MFDAIASVEPEDLVAYATEDLQALYAELEREQRRRTVLTAAVVGHLDRRGAYVNDGHRTIEAWCRSAGRWSPGHAKVTGQIARLLRDQPSVLAAAWAGTIPVAHLQELARAAANPRCGDQIEPFLPILLDEATKLEFVDFRQVVRHWERRADADGSLRDSEHNHRARNARIEVRDNGTVVLTAECDGLQGAILQTIFDRFCDGEFHADWQEAKEIHGDATTKEHLARTPAQRRFDALLKIFVQAASTPRDAQKPEPLVSIMVPWSDWEVERKRRHPHAEPTILDEDDDTVDETGEDDLDDDELFVDLDDVATDASDPADAAGVRDPAAARADPAPKPPPWDPRRKGCQTTTGIVLNPADAFDAAIAGRVRRVVIDARGVAVDVGRRARLFRGAAREAVMLLSTRCPGSGCLVYSGRQADHITSWADLGITATTNGAPPCGHHNRLKNIGFRYELDDDGHWHTYRPDGSEVTDIANAARPEPAVR